MTILQPEDIQTARRSVVRGVVIWTPVFLGLAATTTFFLLRALDGDSGFWVSVVLTGILSLLTGVPAIQSWRDLYADPMETRGTVSRKWSKREMILTHGHYLQVNRRIFRIPKLTYLTMPDEGGVVSVHHYPHTNALVLWEHVETPTPIPNPLQRASTTGVMEWDTVSGETRDSETPAGPREAPPPGPAVHPPSFLPDLADDRDTGGRTPGDPPLS